MSTSDLFTDLTEAQREAVAFPSASHPMHKKKKHLLIEAGAGAGKTHVLSRRAARLCTPRIPGGVHPSRLFLVTFSRAADRELRERVQRTLAGKTPFAVCGRIQPTSTATRRLQSPFLTKPW